MGTKQFNGLSMKAVIKRGYKQGFFCVEAFTTLIQSDLGLFMVWDLDCPQSSFSQVAFSLSHLIKVNLIIFQSHFFKERGASRGSWSHTLK